MGVAGIVGLTALVYYAGYAGEGRRPKSQGDRKSKSESASIRKP